jgi:hypothetical protein
MGERAHADWALDFVRISCIPEARYFEIQFRALSGPDILIGGAEHNDKARADRLQIMADHGFFDPSNLFYECKLPDSTYTVASNQLPPSERGQCGGAPATTKNGWMGLASARTVLVAPLSPEFRCETGKRAGASALPIYVLRLHLVHENFAISC